MVSWQPSAHEVARILAEQNPWHTSGEVPAALAGQVERALGGVLWRRVLDDAGPRRAHVILGPRRVGKTTVMYQTVRRLIGHGIEPARLWWLRMDHPYLMREPLGDLVRRVIDTTGAKPGREALLFLDELVYAPDWDLWLKTFHDENWPVRIAATSSATAALRHRHRESGIGRWDEYLLGPYQFCEYLDLIGAAPQIAVGATLADTLFGLPPGPVPPGLAGHRRRFGFIGGFPELLIADRDSGDDEATSLLRSQQRLRDEAVERAIYKDIPQSFGIDSPMLLERLLYVLAGQSGGVLSPSNLVKDLDGLSQPTLDRYVSYLEQTFLIFRTLNYAGAEASIQRRGRKLYFVDAAIRNAALQRGLAPLSDPADMGLLIENLAASALHELAQQSGYRLSYWRDGSSEVDLILDHPQGPLAFEIASSTTHRRDGLRKLMSKHARLAGRTYLVSPDATTINPEPGSDEPGSMPLDLFLLAVGRQSEAAAKARWQPSADQIAARAESTAGDQ